MDLSDENVLNEVHLELVGWCNAACSYCTWRQRRAPRALLPAALAMRLIDECAAGGMMVKCNGVGEPTLHPELEKILQHADQAGLPEYGLSTNGLELAGELADRLADLVRLQLTIAIHYAQPEKFVERCLDNAAAYLARKPINEKLIFLLVCSEDNAAAYQRHVDAFLPHVEALGNCWLYLKQPLTWPESAPVRGFAPGAQDSALRTHDRVIIEDVATPLSIGAVCDMPSRFLMVRADGTVVPCCVGLGDWGLGPIGDRSLAEVWSSSAMSELRDRWRDASDKIPCGHCQKRDDCLQELKGRDDD